MSTKEEVMEALDDVSDPELNISIVEFILLADSKKIIVS